MNDRKTIVFVLAIAHCLGAIAMAEEQGPINLISNARQVTFEGRRSGEGYFGSDGSKMIFQSERDPKNPFYQIFVLDLNSGETTPVSNGAGKTTCAWLHPDGKRALFASTHEDPKSAELQQAALDRRASGKTKRYEWDYDEHFEIYTTEIGSGKYTNLTNARGYDAEGSYSPDGKWIAFSSNRHAYTETLSPEDVQLLETDAKYLLEIYIMRADGTDLKRLTNEPGYDGGPFFSPDGKRICWRRFTPDGNVAEIWTMNIDGSDQKQITKLGGMSWAPFYHPSGEYLIFTTDIHGRSNFELYIVDVEGKRDPVRVTNLPGFDGLPVFFPDGKRLAWTANRTANKKGQIYFADFDHRKAEDLLEIAKPSDSLKGAAQNRALIHEISSPEITQQDLDFRGMMIKHALDPNLPAFGLFEAYTEVMKKIGFAAPKMIEDADGNFLFHLDSSFGNPQDNAPILMFLTIGARGKGNWIETASHDLASVIEIAQYIAHQTRQGAHELIRPLRFVVLLASADTDSTARRNLLDDAIQNSQPTAAVFAKFDGLVRGESAFMLEGTGTSKIWPQLVERVNVPVGLPLAINEAPHPQSLAFYLHQQRIAAISISTVPQSKPIRSGRHDSKLLDVRPPMLVARVLERLIIEPKSPVFTPITKRTDAVKGRPYLGTEPDYRAQVEGVLIKGVKENGPAHRGGLRGGDIIVEIENKPIADVHAYAAALDELEAGAHILIAVNRDGERVLLRVVVGERDG